MTAEPLYTPTPEQALAWYEVCKDRWRNAVTFDEQRSAFRELVLAGEVATALNPTHPRYGGIL
jgi:hypothetical protein